MLKAIRNIFSQKAAKPEITAAQANAVLAYSLMRMITNSPYDLPAPNPDSFEKYTDLYHDSWIVHSCVKKICDDMSSRVVLVKDGSGKEKDNKHVAEFLNEPYPRRSFGYLVKYLQASLELTGNAYIRIKQFDASGRKYYLPLMPQYVTRRENQWYYCGSEFIPDEEMIHISNFGFSLFGVGSTFGARFLIDTLRSGEYFNKGFFKNGAVLSGFLSTESNMGIEAREKILAEFNSMHAGSGKEWKAGIMTGGLKWNELGTNQKDMDMVNISKDYRSAIMASFGVTPFVLGMMDFPANYTAIEQQRVYWDNIKAKANKLADDINMAIISKIAPGLKIEFDFSDVSVYRADVADKAAAQSQLMKNGYTRNESATMVGLNAPFDKSGDVRYPPQLGGFLSAPKEGKRAMGIKQISASDIYKRAERKRAEAIKYIGQLANKTVAHFDAQAKALDLYMMNHGVPNGYDAVFIRDAEALKFFKAKEPVLNDAVNSYASTELDFIAESLNKAVPFYDTKALSERVRRWISVRAFEWAGDVENTTKQQMDAVLSTAEAEGWSIAETVKELRTFFSPEVVAYRVNNIAETEIAAAAIQGSLEAYAVDDVVNGKGWLHSASEMEREGHVAAGERYGVGGEFVPLDGKFTVMGADGTTYYVDGPHDFPTAGENCFCKCDVFPRIKE